ncbi:GDYXXLXY domain-containing protein [Seonamhaeicola marinus]|uniref:GDYXXLXY domain-containing protein n=1 Tax=Seonamhaeicola marinus TaxID=1912246 RepID=A0A5D0HUF7_9FLAO|nr:GDYXXLXY domain-containing protein [Seonamhaeicola marinus]TYA75004.1 GDYXXLXY domain-containing protein [Seonamhaeicola marinus]
MKTIHVLVLFVIVCLAQIFVPTKMILNREEVLSSGTLYKFKTVPIDPADPFRGKYITLNFEIDRHKTNDTMWQRDEKIYVYLDVDSLGFAKVNKVSREILPDVTQDYVEAKVDWYANYSKELNIEFPFDRYYMEETKAYDAEVAVRENQSDSQLQNVYALVYVKEGASVLKDVIINELPIKDFVEKHEK